MPDIARVLPIVAAMIAALACGGEPPAVRVGDVRFSRSDMLPLLEGFTGDSAAMSTFLGQFVDRQLILADARARGLDRIPEVSAAVYERRRERLQYAYITEKLGRIVVPEDSVRAFYDSLGTIVVYTVMNVGDSLQADSLRRLVLAGADMGGLVARFSTLPEDAARRGRVGPSDLQRLAPGDRLQLAGLGPGDVSRVSGSVSGWRFLQLDSLERVAPGSFDEERQGIYDFIWAHSAERYKHELEDSLRSAFSLTESPGAPELLAAHAIDQRGDFTPFTDSEASAPAYTWTGGSRTVLSLAMNIRGIPPFMPRDARDPEWIRGYIRVVGLYDIMAQRALEMGLDRDPELAAALRSAAEEPVLQAWFDSVVGPRIMPTEEEIAEAWEENRSMLVVPEMRRFSAAVASDSSQREALADMLADGGDPGEETDRLTAPASLLEPGENSLTRFLEPADLPREAASAAFALEQGEALTCTLSGGAVLWLRLEAVEPAREAGLEEARGQISALLAEAAAEAEVRALVDSLRVVYPCEVDSFFFARFWRRAPGEGFGAPRPSGG